MIVTLTPARSVFNPCKSIFLFDIFPRYTPRVKRKRKDTPTEMFIAILIGSQPSIDRIKGESDMRAASAGERPSMSAAQKDANLLALPITLFSRFLNIYFSRRSSSIRFSVSSVRYAPEKPEIPIAIVTPNPPDIIHVGSCNPVK